nr:14575_t:CDS:2 [Entrophospora candida]
MGIVNVEQARIEGVDAVAVVALEHVSADIRKEVTIPVLAKVITGHFVKAQILKAINVDYIDESQVLMPADQCYHINKDDFKVPFACGAKNLGEAFRRITEGAAQETIKGVTISHSYGPLGDFHNNVVRTVEEFFLEKGYLTIAFNFRGSGKSAVEQAGLGYSYGSLISSSVQSLLIPSTTLHISYAFIVKELTDVDHFFASQRMENELVGVIDE